MVVQPVDTIVVIDFGVLCPILLDDSDIVPPPGFAPGFELMNRETLYEPGAITPGL